MAKSKKPAASVPVDANKHPTDTRPNIPTRETAAFATDDVPKKFVVNRDRSLDPQLVWKGKDEQDAKPLDVVAVPIHVQEKIHPQAIIETVKAWAKQGKPVYDLFADFNGLDDFSKRVEFYQHEQHWTNRLILGDSLLVMASLAEKERLRGKVQCVYFDPPYGIKFGSNWQVSTRKRDVKDARAEDLTRQPEQIKAFRDTWELGIHSYLTYIRDRLAAARDLLTESGSIVQIGDENVHLVRSLLDEVFGMENCCGQIIYEKTSSASTNLLSCINDYVLWYTKSIHQVKYRQIHQEKQIGEEGTTQYVWLESPDGKSDRRMKPEELAAPDSIPGGWRIFACDNLTSQRPPQGTDVREFVYDDQPFTPGKGTFKTDRDGLTKLSYAQRLRPIGKSLMYKRFLSDFVVSPISNMWRDTKMTGSRTAFAQLQLEIEASPLQSPDIHSERVSVNELMLAYIEHAEQHYRGPEGKPTGETQHVKVVCRYVRELYGHTLAVEFGPLALKAVRQKFVKAGWCRRSVNQQIERVRRAFRWAAGEELIPFEVYHRLTAVSGLQRGRTEAREPDPVKPVDDAIVDATLQHLNRHVRGLVEFQRLTGCRPEEACRLRRCDIETGGTVWLYRPTQHKGSWRGKPRTIAIGPNAQELLKEFFTANITDHLFSPRRAIEEVRAERSKNRKTPRYPSHMKQNQSKRKTNPKRTPTDRYSRVSYVGAVIRACDKAFPPLGLLAQQEGETLAKWWGRLTPDQRIEVKVWRKDHRWHPNRLRHSYATKVRKGHGLEAAQVLLGHSKADVTQVYAERNEALAVTVASRIG